MAPRALSAVRDFYARWLTYWPHAALNNVIIYHEPADEVSRQLALCLVRASCADLAPRIVSAEMDYYRHLNWKPAVRGQQRQLQDVRAHVSKPVPSDEAVRKKKRLHFQMTLKAFDADRITTAPIIAYTDDDSCMLDHVLPSEIVTDEGRLVARGINNPSSRWMLGELLRSNQGIGIPNTVADFMVEFPVYIVRHHLSSAPFCTHPAPGCQHSRQPL